MDEDPAVEPELDAFSLILPLPYRIAVIFVLGKCHSFRTCVAHGLTHCQGSGHGALIFTIYLSSRS